MMAVALQLIKRGNRKVAPKLPLAGVPHARPSSEALALFRDTHSRNAHPVPVAASQVIWLYIAQQN